MCGVPQAKVNLTFPREMPSGISCKGETSARGKRRMKRIEQNERWNLRIKWSGNESGMEIGKLSTKGETQIHELIGTIRKAFISILYSKGRTRMRGNSTVRTVTSEVSEANERK